MIKEKIVITLIESDYENGDFFDNENCPIAKALKRSGYKEVGVGGRTIDIGDKAYVFSTSNNKSFAWINETIRCNITNWEFEEQIIPLTIHLDEIFR